MSDPMTTEQFDTIISRIGGIETRIGGLEMRMESMETRIESMATRFDTRLKNVEDNMVRKADVFQSVLTVQAFTIALIVGVIVVLNTLVGFGGA